MVRKRNLFSQITDSRFYEGEPIQTWYVTDNISMTNSSQSYTTTVNYEGQIDTSSTRYGPQGIEYYTYTTTTNGNVTATVHPYEYVSTTSQKNVEVVKNTSVSDSYKVAVENSLSYSFSESDTYTYAYGRVYDAVGHTATIGMNIEKPSVVTANWNEFFSVHDIYGNGHSMNLTITTLIGPGDITNNTIVLYIMPGRSGTTSPVPLYWAVSATVNVMITYKSYENNTTSRLFTYSHYQFVSNSAAEWSSTWSYSNLANFPYLTYYSKSTTWNTLTTVINTYEVPAQTTSSWVEPRQVSSLI